MEIMFSVLFRLLLVLTIVPLNAVTVKPVLCPTNKIAPHKRFANWDYTKPKYAPRTFGTFYELFSDDLQNDSPSSLLEKPQDDNEDCGEIDDYDESDLSSLTQQSQKRHDRQLFKENNNKFFFGGLFNRPQQSTTYPQRPPNVTSRPPPVTSRPPLASRPPYWSGGVFGDNYYQQPVYYQPSNNIKPVHEDVSQETVSYKPAVVGGIVGSVVGVSPVVPSTTVKVQTRPGISNVRFPPTSVQATNHRPRFYDDSIFGSFVNLLYK